MPFPKKIALQFTPTENYTLIYSEGTRSTLSDSTKLAEIIADKMRETPNKKLLLDYRKAIYTIPSSDAYNLVKVFELKLTDYRQYKMAVIVSKQNEDFGRVWASVGRQRGFDFEIFKTFEEAESWLLS
ncbi:hypothetical protein [Marivirga atlantica]|uniref:SpoIIAA-like n=1 Tax=Marivirga atlantica TaxID=1548457 RepID=A0A937AJR8_9BACT|nr:hypothetical protein [Marivirga atlantica]MBL0766779.1 hypothetical protein [Marivirga atlantica]